MAGFTWAHTAHTVKMCIYRARSHTQLAYVNGNGHTRAMNLPSETELDDDDGVYTYIHAAFVFAGCCCCCWRHRHFYTRVFCQCFTSSLKQYFIFLRKRARSRVREYAHEDVLFWFCLQQKAMSWMGGGGRRMRELERKWNESKQQSKEMWNAMCVYMLDEVMQKPTLLPPPPSPKRDSISWTVCSRSHATKERAGRQSERDGMMERQ